MLVSIPVIASGGAGTLEHFYDALTEGKCRCRAGSIFIPLQRTGDPSGEGLSGRAEGFPFEDKNRVR